MIICLSGFVIAGTSPTMPIPGRNDMSVMERVGVSYSPHHQQLLQQFAAAPLRGERRSARRPLADGRPGSSASESSRSASPAGAGRRVRTLYACLGESEGELSFEPNQIITDVAASGEPGWLRGLLDGKLGLVPENYVEPLP